VEKILTGLGFEREDFANQTRIQEDGECVSDWLKNPFAKAQI
jgi:hypothetical protein